MRLIAVNCINLSTAGGKAVVLNFMHWCLNNAVDEYVFYTPEIHEYVEFREKGLKVEIVSNFYSKTFIGRLLWDNLVFSFKLPQDSYHTVFTMGNFVPRTGLRSIVLYMWPYPNYQGFEEVWKRMLWYQRLVQRIKVRLFGFYLRRADVILPQTRTSETRLHEAYPFSRGLTRVVPMGSNSMSEGDTLDVDWADKKCLKLMALTRYYTHKNLEILVNVAQLIKAKSLPYKIYLTISENQGKGAQKLLQRLNDSALTDVIVNIGPVKFRDVPELYKSMDGMILPTLLESYSANYADSMFYGLPIFTSNLDFALEACGTSGNYFDPLSEESIINVLELARKNPDLVRNKVLNGIDLSRKGMNWNDIGLAYNNVLQLSK
jgi:glycosyltransferase involved in cell wall biosynthesis